MPTSPPKKTCKSNVDDIRTTMNEIRSLSEINQHIHALLFAVATILVFTLAIFIYPIMHIVYKRSSTSRLSFTMYICIIVLFLIMFVPLYGWITAMK